MNDGDEWYSHVKVWLRKARVGFWQAASDLDTNSVIFTLKSTVFPLTSAILTKTV
jgi:hypothetical protein